MPGLSGQVLRVAGRACSIVLRLAMALLLIAGLGVAALSWRLAEGPMHVPMLNRAVSGLIARAGLEQNVEIADIVLNWGGFRHGTAAPLGIRVSGLKVRDEAGAVRHQLPDIAVSLSLPQLLTGTVAPTEVTLRDPDIVLERDQDGDVSLAMGRHSGADEAQGGSGELLGQLLGKDDGNGLFSALRSVVITGGRVAILDRQLHLTWQLRDVGIALRRTARDGVDGEGEAQLVLPGPGATVPVHISARASGQGPRVEGTLSMPALEPARLAGLMPALAPLGLIDTSVSLDIQGALDGTSRTPPQLRVALKAGAGSVTFQPGRRIGFAGLELLATGAPDMLTLEKLSLSLPPLPAGPGGRQTASPVISATGQASLRGGRWRGEAALSLNRLDLNNLTTYWPPDLSPHARDWLKENLTAGVASAGRFALAAESAEDLSDLAVTRVDGTVRIDGATVHWLRPVPPVENVSGSVRLGLKEIVIRAEGGRQSGSALTVSDTQVRLYDLDTSAEKMQIQGRIRGPVADTVALLRHPRLRLFEKRPLELNKPGGQIDATLQMGFPLLVDLPDDAIRVDVHAKLTALQLADVVAGQDLDRGTADLTVDNSRLRATGNARIGGIQAALAVEMGFRPGPPGQTVERIQANARTDMAALKRFGLDLEGLADGPVTVEAVMEKPRVGDTRVTLRGDLRDTRLSLSPLAWAKPPGQPGTARAQLRIGGEALKGLEGLVVEAPQLSLRGSGTFVGSDRLEQLTIADATIGRTRLSGDVRPPARDGAAWTLRLRGPVLDLQPALEADDKTNRAEPPSDLPPAADIVVYGAFDRVLLGGQRFLTGLQGQIRADGGGVLRQGRVSARVAGTAPFDVMVTPRGAGRDLRLTSDDAGALLAAFDVLDQLRGGKLLVNGHWANNRADSILSGTAELDGFQVLEGQAIGKLLQALTVYGVFEAVQGPGLAFSRLVAPFSLSPTALTVREAQAFSASLGLTANGTLNRSNRTLDFEGTIVPAYVLNSLLGRLPLIGRLFSAEKGGGLFAARYGVTGPVDNPHIAVNPLSMLTPGFLRGLFGSGQPAAP